MFANLKNMIFKYVILKKCSLAFTNRTFLKTRTFIACDLKTFKKNDSQTIHFSAI